MLPKRKIGFGYIVGKLIICSVWYQCNYFSNEVGKVFFIRLRSKVPSIWKINMNILIEKHVHLFLTSDDFFSNHMSNILYLCLE